MGAHRVRAVFVGSAFLVAMASSLVGGAVLENAIGPSGARLVAGDASGLALGVVLEMINVVAVIGIAVGLYPLFRLARDDAALGYVAVRVLEAAFLALAALIPLVAATSADRGSEPGSAAASQAGIVQLLAFRSEILGVMVPAFFAIGAVVLYAWLWSTALVPRYVAAWGMLGVIGIVLANVMDVGMAVVMVLALPIIANEIFLGVWLIVRGFATGRRPGVPKPRRAAVS